MDIDTSKTFETTNLDLGAYLMLEGIQYLGSRIAVDTSRNEPKAVLLFFDQKGNCRDIERLFMLSREKKYRELNKFLLKDIHLEIKKFNAKLSKQVKD